MMATYKVTAPDGNSYQINAPDDATPDQVQAYAQANYQHPDVQSGQTLTHASPDLPTVTVHPSLCTTWRRFQSVLRRWARTESAP
jgi:hypothetical protein